MNTQSICDAVVAHSLQVALETPRGQSFSAHVKSNLDAMAIYRLIIEHHDDVFGSSIFDAWKGYTADEITAEQASEIADNALVNMEFQNIDGARKSLTLIRAKKILRSKVGDLLAYHAKQVFTEVQ